MNCEAGYTLVELIVVMVIIGIMATQVVFMYTDPDAKVKSAAFNMRGDLNLARFESVNRNQDMLVEFTLGATDGYRICLDTDTDNTCADEAADDVIKEVTFKEEVQYYDPSPIPSGAPATTPAGTALDGNDGVLIATGTDYFSMQPDGTSDKNGTIVVYYPEVGNHQVVRGQPIAVIISPTTGRVHLKRWRKGQGWRDK